MPEVLESGHIFVLNQPGVIGCTSAPGWIYLVLSAAGQDLFRRLVVGRQRVRVLRGGMDRLWGFVDRVGDSLAAMEAEFDLARYEAPAPPSSPSERNGGHYLLVSREHHSHLVYSLGSPSGWVEPEAAYIMAVKNPEAGRPIGLGWQPRHRPELPERLREQFRGRRFHPAAPEWLNCPGLEILLVRRARPLRAAVALNPRAPAAGSEAVFEALRAERRGDR